MASVGTAGHEHGLQQNASVHARPGEEMQTLPGPQLASLVQLTDVSQEPAASLKQARAPGPQCTPQTPVPQLPVQGAVSTVQDEDGSVVVVVLVVTGSAGAQTSLEASGVTERAPNWSFHAIGVSAPFGHLTL